MSKNIKEKLEKLLEYSASLEGIKNDDFLQFYHRVMDRCKPEAVIERESLSLEKEGTYNRIDEVLSNLEKDIAERLKWIDEVLSYLEKDIVERLKWVSKTIKHKVSLIGVVKDEEDEEDEEEDEEC